MSAPLPPRRHFLRVATGLAAVGSLGLVGARAAGLRWDRRMLLGFGTTLSTPTRRASRSPSTPPSPRSSASTRR